VKRTKGFTLIEMLVVIAILAVVAAIVFPVLSRAREKSRQSICAANVRQICQSMLMYAQDNDETLPSCDTNDGKSWSDLIQPYAHSRAILNCPNSPFPRYSAAAPLQTQDGHYGYNGELSKEQVHPPLPFVGLKLAVLRKSATTYMIMDSGYHFISPLGCCGPLMPYQIANDDGTETSVMYLPGSSPYTGDYRMPDAASQDDYTNGRHNGGVVVGFCDGHVKWLNPAEICRQASQYKSDWSAKVTSNSDWAP
jgi:prepilin-type N-terminal cleavage/methylation domain-containing protein/prepilin-type processing-associated H-X9-DG protein